jgi:hypothetical protein
LLEALKHEPVDHNRSKLVYTVSGFVSGLLTNNEFPEFIPTMFDWAKNPSPVLRENALGIFNTLSSVLAEVGISPYLVGFKQIFEANLRDTDHPIVRLAALEALFSIVEVIDKQQFPAFQELIPDMLQVIAQLLNVSDYQSANAAIECFIETAMPKPSFFSKHANMVISAMYQIAKTDSIDDSVRHLATEFMVSLTESSPNMIRKIPNFVDNLFPLCMSLMLDLEHNDEDWQEAYEEEEMDLSNYDVGLESLDRLALALGGTMVQPVAFKYIPQFLNNPDWKHRHTGLMTISQTAEGCEEEYEAHLANIVQMGLTRSHDPHPRVRYAAIHCSAQLATDFQGTFQEKFHSSVVPALLATMDDPFPKVQSHAATAIVNFVDECEKPYIEPYLDHILTKLLNLLRTGRRYVQEQSLSAISAVADCAEHLFQKYYDAIMPFLKEILDKANGKQDRMLRARAIECVSLIGVAVGKEKFGKDAQEVMQLLIRTQQGGLENDDPQHHHISQAWARIAKCLGADFLPYMNYVMPPLLQSADLQPEVIVSEVDENDDQEEEGMESVTLTIKGVGDRRISIRTSTLEEKALACNMLFTYISELKEHFLPFVEPVAKVVIPLLKFAYLEDIRETAATIMPQLLNTVKVAAEKNMCDASILRQLLDGIFGQLIEAIKIEPEVRTASMLVESLYDCVKVVGDNCLSDAQLAMISEVLKTCILASMERKQAVIQELQGEDDEEEQARLDDDAFGEDQFLTVVAEAVGGFLKTHKGFIPYFIRDLWPIFSSMLNQNYGDEEHRIGLCVICDFVETSGTASHQFFDPIIPALLTYSQHANPEVRQAAVYGIGACAQYAGEPFEQVVPNAIEALLKAVNRPDASTNKKTRPATANAVSALFKFIQFRSNNAHISANAQKYLNIWLQTLPVSGDYIEARIVHGHLVALIQKNDPIILGQNYSNIPKILQIFADIVSTNLVNEESQAAIIQILKQLSTQPQIIGQAMNSLTTEQQNKLKGAFANSPVH